ncbi:MAG: AraC family transcriptional regulator [Acidobacteria bacterium]|nr:AraC family transcriptional regulator [Acidobacteriota bacterium]
MLKTTDNFAETTKIYGWSDVLSEALKYMRISGSLLLRESYRSPWSVAIPTADRLGALLGVSVGARVVAFHLVERGHCEIKLKGGKVAVIEAGEMALCFAGVAHHISQGANPKSLPIETILAGGGNVFRPGKSLQARGASLMCGVFLLHDTFLNPLFAALPPLLRANVAHPGGFNSLSGLAHLMAQEIDRKSLGSGYVIERLLEALCAEAIRSHIETLPREAAGWLSGIKDPIVGRAIAMIHAQPGDEWSVNRLAQGVAMSPSRFAARFTAALGDSPMVYVAKWRMKIACQLLYGTQQGVAQIAAEVGYENQAAFNRAFKKLVGLPPAAWRASKHS